MTKFILFLLPLLSGLATAAPQIKVATFDSGFGGFFTAKEIEKQGQELSRTHEAQFSISHYGDTANAPYGEKSPARIAELSAKGISRAFDDGAEMVFIACNTASTQYQAIKALLPPQQRDRIVSIIDSSVAELRSQIDERLKTQSTVRVAVLATPATIRAGAYVRALAEVYKVEATSAPLKTFVQKRWYQAKGPQVESVATETTLTLPQGQKIILAQMGPGNWVDMIEHGADTKVKQNAVAADLALLSSPGKWDVVGEFCTHFPAVDTAIKTSAQKLGLASAQTSYIKQGPLMAQKFREIMLQRLSAQEKPQHAMDVRARIFVSGDNIQETRALAQEIFPQDPTPEIQHKTF